MHGQAQRCAHLVLVVLLAVAAAIIVAPASRGADGPDTQITNYDYGQDQAEFWFNSPDSSATFECSLDGSPFASCVSPKQYTGLAVGTHRFEVRAVDSTGAVDPFPANLTFTLLAPPPTPEPGPPNDAWSAPQLLSGASASVDGTTVGATTDWNEPWTPYGAKATVWYVYTAARNGSVTFTATGSGFTTRIATCLGQDAGSCVFNASGIGSLTLQTFQGAQYRISVDTADGGTGPFTLSWGYDSTGPGNDYIADAQELVGESGSIDGSNVGATTETNEPRHDGSAGENTGHSVWYRWTAPVAGTVFFDTAGSAFDTQLRAYTQSYDGSLVGQGSYQPDLNPWTTSSRVELRNVSAGATYLLAVDGEAGATGAIRLSWRTVVPQGDDFELPVIQMWSPELDAHVTGTIHFMADASDNTGIDRVAYTIQPEASAEPAWFVGEAFAPPYDVEFDTSVLPPGRYSIDATAYDFNGNGASNGYKITVGNIPKPTLTLPKPFTREATRPDGALVKFSATAHDFKGVALAVTCTPRSGVPFPLGRTVVTCTTRDSYGGSASGSFAVTVVDTTAPVLSTPETLAFDATSPAGATVVFAVAVSDAVSTSLTAGCDPASGSVFAIGDANVRCAATDAAGNTGETAFVLHVRGADEQLDALSALVTSWRVETSLADKLVDQIADVGKHLDVTQGSAACGGLKELSDLAAKESGKRLTADQSSRFAGEVSRITAVVGC